MIRIRRIDCQDGLIRNRNYNIGDVIELFLYNNFIIIAFERSQYA